MRKSSGSSTGPACALPPPGWVSQLTSTSPGDGDERVNRTSMKLPSTASPAASEILMPSRTVTGSSAATPP